MGNVLESRGSVVPLFRGRIARGAPVPVTDPDVRRYMMTLEESVDLLLRTERLEGPGGVFVPVVGPPVRIVDLARDMLRAAGRPADGTGIFFTGLRPGDKMSEDLHSPLETPVATEDPRLMRVEGPRADSGLLAQRMAALGQAVDRRDAAAVIELLEGLVAGYRPSSAALQATGRARRRPVEAAGVAAVTTSRADYSHLYWPLKDLAAHPEVDLRLLAMGPHLSPEFGETVREIPRSSMWITVSSACSVRTPMSAWPRPSGSPTQSLADLLGAMRPNWFWSSRIGTRCWLPPQLRWPCASRSFTSKEGRRAKEPSTRSFGMH